MPVEEIEINGLDLPKIAEHKREEMGHTGCAAKMTPTISC